MILVPALRRQRYSVSIFILARWRPAAARHELTTNDVDDASQVGPLLDQVVKPVASFTGDGAYDQDSVYRSLTGHQLKAAVIVPPRATALPRGTATIEPTGHCHQSSPYIMFKVSAQVPSRALADSPMAALEKYPNSVDDRQGRTPTTTMGAAWLGRTPNGRFGVCNGDKQTVVQGIAIGSRRLTPSGHGNSTICLHSAVGRE